MTIVLSPHEERIERGLDKSLTTEESIHKHQRVNEMLQNMLDDPPRVAIDRAKWLTQSFQESEGFPLTYRWALAMKKIADHIPIDIGDTELVVGRCGQGTRYGLIYPELRGGWLPKLKEMADRVGGTFYITDEDLHCVLEEIAPYWKGKTWHEAYHRQLPEATRKILWEDGDIYASRGIINAITTQDSGLVWALDYEKVLSLGFQAIKDSFSKKLDSLSIFSSEENYDKAYFYKAVILSCDAVIAWAHRYAEEAESMAGWESNPARRQELKEIARICRKVPQYPAESFHEAIQSIWFTNAFSRFEQIMAGQMGLGRIDQYLYPYYQKDKEKDILDDDHALELLECLWLNLSRVRRLVPTSSISNYQGYPHFEQACLGGLTKDGRDASNPLSYLILQSKKEFPLDFPDLSVRIHSLTPEPFLRKAVELIKEGTGFPKLYNDEEIIPLLIAKGATIEEARNYTGCGCAEVRLINRETYMTQGSQLNIASIVEMTLRNGRMLLLNQGEEQIGLVTGDPRNFDTWEEFWAAFVKQLCHLFTHAFVNRHVGDMTKPGFIAAPFQSAFHDLCVEQGLDIHQGQGKFKNDISLGNIFVIGVGTAIDSLAAIKKLVYEDKFVTMDRLIDALNKNFQGEEVLRQFCLNCPKYGNADPYADSIGKEIDYVMNQMTEQYTNVWGGKDNISYVPVTSHVGLGALVGATPDGRFAGKSLSEGVSATQGCDINGPTAVLVSIRDTKNTHMKNHEARLLNIKLTPQVVGGEEGTRALVSYVRTWCDMKHWHIQFNIVNKDTLLAAQKDPQKYRSLLVRVAGFSAYFVELSPELQNEIIARTEHQTF